MRARKAAIPGVEVAEPIPRTSVAVAGILAEARYATKSIYPASIAICHTLFERIQDAITMIHGNELAVIPVRLPVTIIGIKGESPPVNFTREDSMQIPDEVFDDSMSDEDFRNAVRSAAQKINIGDNWSIVCELATRIFTDSPKWVKDPFNLL